MAIKDYQLDPDLNTTISGINIAEGCPPSGINNAIRQLMADVKAEKDARDQAQTAQTTRDAAQDKAISDEVAARERAVSALNESISALDAAVVHKSGAETIAGAKTFTGNVTVPSTPANSTGTQIVTANWLHTRGFGEKIPVVSGVDINTMVTTGVYAVGSMKNSPSISNAFVIVERTNVAVRQIFYAIGNVGADDHKIYTRNGKDENGVQTWGDWVQIMTSKGGTFTGGVAIKQNAPFVDLYSLAMTAGVTPTSNKYAGIRIYDTAGVEISNMFYRHGASGYADSFIRAYSIDKSTYKDIGVRINSDGTSFGYAPTPAANSNTNHIATTAWVRDKGVLVESWHSGANWYRKYSDGWIEQGGFVATTTSRKNQLVNLQIAFTTTDYTVMFTGHDYSHTDSNYATSTGVMSKTTTSFEMLQVTERTSNIWKNHTWYACGY